MSEYLSGLLRSEAMKQKIEELILQALETLQADGVLSLAIIPPITIERTRDAQHGDFASNLALILAKSAKVNPSELAIKIIAALPKHNAIMRVELAGPGFINFFIDPSSQYQIINQIHSQGRGFGLSKIGAEKKFRLSLCQPILQDLCM